MSAPNLNEICGNCGEAYGFHGNEFCPHGKGTFEPKATAPDITQHPLYRPHHGDMKGWRYLEAGEVRAAGDEFDWREQGEGWSLITYRHGEPYTAQEMDLFIYRRRISPESKPADQKRFVTAIAPATEENLTLLAGLGWTIREGNALAVLDGIEDRAIEAVRQAVKGGRV